MNLIIDEVLLVTGETDFTNATLVVVGSGWVAFASVPFVRIETTRNLTREEMRS
jgi:hypothetical protein